MGYSDTERSPGSRPAAFPDDLQTLSNLDGWEVTEGEPDPRGYDLFSSDGEKIGTIQELLASRSARKAYFAIVKTGSAFQHRRYLVPLDRIQFDSNQRRAQAGFPNARFDQAPEYHGDEQDFRRYSDYWTGSTAAAGMAAPAATESPAEAAPAAAAPSEIRVPVMEESARVRRETREVGSVMIRKSLDVQTKHVSEPVTRTRVVTEMRAVPADPPYAAGADAARLREGETLRVPVVEEELVVEKVPRVTEEIVIRTRPETEQVERDVTLRHERVEVEEEGDVDLEQPQPQR